MGCSHRNQEAAVAADVKPALPPLIRDRASDNIQERLTQLFNLLEMQQVRRFVTGLLSIMTYLTARHLTQARNYQLSTIMLLNGFDWMMYAWIHVQEGRVAVFAVLCSLRVAHSLHLTCSMAVHCTEWGEPLGVHPHVWAVYMLLIPRQQACSLLAGYMFALLS